MGFLTRLRENQAGNVLVMVAAGFIPLLGFIGGGVDMARIYLVKTRLQHACDAGALAGRKQMAGGAWNANNDKARTTSEMHEQARLRQQIEEDMQRALERGEFHLAYQPVIDTQTGALAGFEALVRWTHGVRGVMSPAIFIPIAEESGLINELGEWVLRTACLEAAKWPDSVRVAVNISPVQFASQALPTLVTSALAYAGLPADRLELEITEGALLNDTAKTRAAIATLKGLGVKISLDDFGTGYSSLGYLRTIPFDKIKIDQSFVKGATLPGNNNVPIIKAIVSLANDLGMITTAEGVETEDQLALVRALGCTLIQGYIYGRPMDAASAMARAQGNGPAVSGYRNDRAERRRLIRAGRMTARAASQSVRLRNISSSGAMVETSLPLHVGEVVSLEIGLLNALDADVRWVKDGRAGLKFMNPIDLEEIFIAKPRTAFKAFVPDYLSRDSSDLYAEKVRLDPKTLQNR